ncbi:MAG TPA: HD domain-containing phosphohydrolase [Anaerolineales bacterium]|jgi:putative nucleotidyltransferase with HDIG domain|nr:HD domain-containing phosphohydrolase [Anaerolineales bacterium]
MNTILIVDDQKQNLYLLKALLGGHGYEVVEATNGAEALELARANPPDVIISDILMPVMDGFSLCQEWKKDDRLKNIPFVFYTATYTDPKDEELALSLGAARFIVKPVETEEFVSILRQVIAEIDSGALSAPQESLQEEMTYYRMYNETLIRKLEDKMLQLEELNRELTEEIVERKQAEERIQRQLKRQGSLRMIDIAISSSFDLHFILDIVLQQVLSQLGVDASAVLLFNSQLQTLEYAANRGFYSNALHYTQLKLGAGYAGRVVLENKIIHVSSLMETGSKLAVALQLANESFTDYYGIPLIVKGEIKGVLEIYHRSLLHTDSEWLEFLETLAGQAAIAIDNAQLFERLQRSNLELGLAYDATIAGWSRAMDLRDKETKGHTERVTDLTLKLARHLDLNESEMIHMRRGALLHDIGKMGVPDNILHKPDKLTDAEWEIMRQHPSYAYEMLTAIDYLKPALDIPFYHHEKWDGTGYPQGLKGEQISLVARIFAVVDVWDALTSKRPYRSAWTKEQALEYIKEQSGKHFDPQVVKAFLTLINNE